jgi:hypothetical protein
MYLETKRDGEAQSSDPFSLESLIAWLKTQEPEKTYSYFSGQCLICQHLAAHGVETPTAVYGSFADPFVRFEVAAMAPHTFGAALQRALAVQAARDACWLTD